MGDCCSSPTRSYHPPPPPYNPNYQEQRTYVPPQQSSFPQQNIRCAVIKNTSSGLCLDGTQYEVKLQHYNGSSAQEWVLEPLGGGRFIIVNRANGAALDIEGGADCGANLIVYEKHGRLNQQWYINPDGTIVSAGGNLAVDVCDGTCFPGNILIAYDRHGGPNQQFYLQYHDLTITPPFFLYHIISRTHPDCFSSPTPRANSDSPTLLPQQSNLPPPPQQNVRCAVIRNKSSGLCLEATHYDVILQQCNGGLAQQWILEPSGGGRLIIINRGNSAALDIQQDPECGARLITYEKHGGVNQQWYINPDGTIVSAALNYLAVDVCDDKCYPGNSLIAYNKHGGPSQQFHLEYF